MHGGTVLAHSDGEGQGSEFVVRLPAAPRAGATEALDAAPGRGRARARRVVVVEDNADSRELLCALLDARRLRLPDARTAAPPRSTLVDEFAPDVAILDVGLPEMDGFEIARRIRADARHAGARLVALTGYGQATDRAATLAAGFDEHLVKPVQPDRLLDLLARLGPQRPGSDVAGGAGASALA